MAMCCIEKIFSIILCFFLLGCESNYNNKKILKLKETKLDELSCIFLDLYDDIKIGQAISVSAALQKIKSDYSVHCIYDTEGFCECECRTGKKNSEVILVRCVNLGRWKNTCDIILCDRWKKGSRIHHCQIILCSRVGDQLYIYKTILLRTRYVEGVSSTPVFDNDDNIYFLTNYDIQDFASIVGISGQNLEKIRKEGYPIHWNSCRAVYNISTDTSKIFSITLNSNIKYCPELQNILPFINSMHNNKQYYIDRANIPIFLKQFKLGCQKTAKKRNVVKPDNTPLASDKLLLPKGNYQIL